MNAAMRWALLFGCVFVAPATLLQAAEIEGTLTETSGDVATIAFTTQQSPGVGDKVQVFGRIPGLDVPVLVGRGRVTEVRGATVLAKIDSRGKLAAGQMARITLAAPQGGVKAPEPPPPPTTPPPSRGTSDISGRVGPPSQPPQSTSDISGRVVPPATREMTGKVAAVNGPYITIAVESDLLPKPGDPLEVFGEGPGGLTRMGSGRVIEILNRKVMGRVERASGAIRVYQLVKIAARTSAGAIPPTGAVAGPRFWNANEIFAVESAWLATLGGQHDQSEKAALREERLAWAQRQSFEQIARRLAQEFHFEFDNRVKSGEEASRRFYAEASARLAAYGVDLGDRGSNLRQPEPHFQWAQQQTTTKLREAIEEKVLALLRGTQGNRQ